MLEGVNAKVCSRCGELKPYSEFNQNGKRWLKAQCRSCQKIERRVYQLSTYGLTLESYDERLKTQGNKCACCGTTEFCDRYGYAHVDHCHKTGEVRGLICRHCNVALGLMGDNLAGVAQSVVYLAKRGLDLPGRRKAVAYKLAQIVFDIGGVSFASDVNTALTLKAELLEVPEVSEEHTAA